MKLFITTVMLAAGFSPAIAGSLENQAAGSPLSFSAGLPPAVSPARVPAPEAVKAPVQNWTAAVKTAVERELDAGGFIGFTDLQELPPGVRRQLEQEWQTLPEGPGNSSEAFKLLVNNRTAFIVQSYIYSDSMRLYVFNAAGVRVAYGEGTADTDFAWSDGPAPAKGMPARTDVFKALPACTIVDAMFFRQPSMPEAIEMLNSCMQDVSARYGFQVKAGVMVSPFGGPGSGPQGSNRGISLVVPGNLPAGNRLLSDLRFSLKKRNNQLFGYPAGVRQSGDAAVTEN